MRRVPFWSWLPACTLAFAALACGTEDPPINRVGVNVVEKSLFQGSWYMSRVVVDVDYEAAGAMGTFPGDVASDQASDFTAMPRIRWVIDENNLYAYRDYQLVAGGNGEDKSASGLAAEAKSQTSDDTTQHAETMSSLPVAAYKIEKHFDIKRAYEPTTGEQRNVIEENDLDRPWFQREFMRVDWSKNLLPGYFGQTQDLNELLGLWKREPTDLYVQDASKFPASYRPSFERMQCDGPKDTSAACTDAERDLAGDYAKGDLYHMSFVSQEIMSPQQVQDPESGAMVNWCTTKVFSNPTPACTSITTYVRTSFLKVSDKRQYEPLNYVDARFDRFGFFRLAALTDDRSTGSPDDPAFGLTDFKNYNVNRHNIWQKWHDDDGKPIPYTDRDVRKIVWYTTPELPAHLVQPTFEVVGLWNEIFMSTVRKLRDQPLPSYPDVTCQKDNADAYCYCETDDSGKVLNPTCAGKYDPFKKPGDYAGEVQNPFDCHVEVPDDANNIDMNSPGLSDTDFNPWFKAKFVGDECVTILRINNCNKSTTQVAQDKPEEDNADQAKTPQCQERGDLRYKFLSYVAMPGTSFLGIATMRGDPVTGEILAGDANIGGPALDQYRTTALQQYDLLSGRLTDLQLQVGEDVRGYFENVGRVSLPPRPRTDFNPASLNVSESLARELDGRMKSVVSKLNKLKGPDGRQAVMSDLKQNLVGTDFEQRLVSGLDALSSSDDIAPGTTVSGLTDAQMNEISPLRNPISKVLQKQNERETRYSRAAVELGNEYTDDSVAWFVSRHTDWPRARLEFEINRLLYRETELHEMGHCLGLRHDFGGSADSLHYRDEYYDIGARYPLPNEVDFDENADGSLSADETLKFQTAYEAMRSKRELAGIDGAMNSSIMEYTANWYERLQPLGKYDSAAINFGYGDMVEAYDGQPGGKTPRVTLHYYQGGETCNVDSDCPYAPGGSRSADLMSMNMQAGVTQHCIDNPSVSGSKLCSNSDDDLQAAADGGSNYHPLKYRYCADERADSTLGWCSRFDEGDSYREIVRNIQDSYDRMYLFSAFRRYRTTFSASSYQDALLSRRLNILQVVYQNLIYQYLNDPSFRQQSGAFGFYDQFLATTDILNFYARILAQPDVGGYNYDPQTGTYTRTWVNADAPGEDLGVPLGLGRYFYSDYQAGLTGIERLERIGSFFDKVRVIELLAQRGISTDYTRDVQFYANFYDLFPNEMQQIFTGMIRGSPKALAPRVVCDDNDTMPKCSSPRLLYMDFYRGDCSKPETCRPNPADVTYGNMPILDGGANITLQTYAALAGLTDFPVYFDTTFSNQLFVCIEGQADCYKPDDNAKDGVDYVRYTSPRYARTFIAFQVEPTQAVAEQTSIGFAMVKEARDLDVILEALRKERDGAKKYSADNLTQDDLNALKAIGYDPPRTTTAIDSEITRVENRVVDLESFLNQLIELHRQVSINGINTSP